MAVSTIVVVPPSKTKPQTVFESRTRAATRLEGFFFLPLVLLLLPLLLIFDARFKLRFDECRNTFFHVSLNLCFSSKRFRI